MLPFFIEGLVLYCSFWCNSHSGLMTGVVEKNYAKIQKGLKVLMSKPGLDTFVQQFADSLPYYISKFHVVLASNPRPIFIF